MPLKNQAFSLFIVAAIALSLAGCISLSPQGQGPTIAATMGPAASPTVMPATPTPSPISSLPTGTQIIQDLQGGYGQLTINNNVRGEDAVVVMAPADDPETAVLAVYVKGGESYTVYGIADGQYVLYDMIGTNWNSTYNAFLNPGEYMKFNDTLDYVTTNTTSKAYTVSINAPGIGPYPVHEISPADMPSLAQG